MDRRHWSSWLLLASIFLVVSDAGASPANKTIRLGYLSQYLDMAGAINIAIEKARNDNLLRDYHFRYSCSC